MEKQKNKATVKKLVSDYENKSKAVVKELVNKYSKNSKKKL
jgi:hypothetical protein